MSQTEIGDFPTGGTSNADRLGECDSGRQAPLSQATAAGATVDVPEHVGEYERVEARHAGEILRWSDGTDSVSVIRCIGSGKAFEVSRADRSVPNPGRFIGAADERAGAIECAREYMRGERRQS